MIEKLLTVKSIVTLMLTAVFAFLAITGKVTAEQFMTVFTVIIGFYFGTQRVKDDYEADQALEEAKQTRKVLTGQGVED